MSSANISIEVDYYWEQLSIGGDETAQQCAWLKDKDGISWQIVPRILVEMLNDPEKSQPAMTAMLHIKKIDIDRLKRATARSYWLCQETNSENGFIPDLKSSAATLGDIQSTCQH
jgi:hypothetical protein